MKAIKVDFRFVAFIATALIMFGIIYASKHFPEFEQSFTNITMNFGLGLAIVCIAAFIIALGALAFHFLKYLVSNK